MVATVPFVSIGHRGVGCCSKGCCKRGFWIRVFVLEVDVEGTADDLGHGYAFEFGEGIDSLTLLISEVHLGTGC